MSLVANLESFATRVGQEIKEVRSQIGSGGGGGSSGPLTAFDDWKIVDVSGSSAFVATTPGDQYYSATPTAISGGTFNTQTGYTVAASVETMNAGNIMLPVGAFDAGGTNFYWGTDSQYNVKLGGVNVGTFSGGGWGPSGSNIVVNQPVSYTENTEVQWTTLDLIASNTISFAANAIPDVSWLTVGTFIFPNGNETVITEVPTVSNGIITVNFDPPVTYTDSENNVYFYLSDPDAVYPWVLPSRDFALGANNLRGYAVDYHYASPNLGTGIGRATVVFDDGDSSVDRRERVVGDNDDLNIDGVNYSYQGLPSNETKALFAYTDDITENVKIQWSGKAYYSSNSVTNDRD